MYSYERYVYPVTWVHVQDHQKMTGQIGRLIIAEPSVVVGLVTLHVASKYQWWIIRTSAVHAVPQLFFLRSRPKKRY